MLEQGHGNTMHVHGCPCYGFITLDMNRTNRVWPCSELITLLILIIVLCLNMSYIIKYYMSKASTLGTNIAYDILNLTSIYDHVIVAHNMVSILK